MRILMPSSFTRRLVVAALVLATAACASGGGRSRPATSAPPPAADAASPLEGEWRLTSMQLADGGSRRVTGFLRFDRFSTITVKAELAPDEPVARPPRTVAPAARAQWRPTIKPWVWNKGRQSSSLSCGAQAQAANNPVTVAITLLWVIMAPLLRPVVPEV